MRTAFVETLSKLARKDKNVMLLTGDLGHGMFEPFVEEFPKQFLNMGVAEQNMIGVAAGLAMIGKKVFVYSISTFATMRPFEQIRNDVCYQNLPVFIIGGGSAFSYSLFGCSHFPIEDLGIMSILPNMRVFSPGDPIEVEVLVEAAYEGNSPAYIRLGRKGEPKLHKNIKEVRSGKFSTIRKGKDATIIITGRILSRAKEAAQILLKENISVRILSAHTLKPFDNQAVIFVAKETGSIVTCEEHLLRGGLATSVQEVIVQNNISIPVISLGIPDEFPKGVGWQDYFFERYNLTAQGMIDAVKKCIKLKK
jgi:transketolase